MSGNEFLLILGMALVTFAARYPVLALVSKAELPPALLTTFKFIPPAVLTAIILPSLLAPDGNRLDFSLTNDYLVAGLAATLTAWRTKKLLVTLAVGMGALWGWRLLLPWLTTL